MSTFSSVRDPDAVKRLRTNLLHSLPDAESSRMIGLTSVGAAEAKDEIALDRAKSLAEMGDCVLFVDADLRAERL